jgi:hypothetical protein
MSDKLLKLTAEHLAGLTGQDREDYLRGLQKVGLPNPEARMALIAAFKRLRPDATERELDIMVSGKAPRD